MFTDRVSKGTVLERKILVVEDEPDVQNLVVYHLRRAGYETCASGDGVEAWSLVRRLQPKLVILDILLPGISGWELCQLIKKHRLIQNTPVIMLTAKAEVENRLKGFQLGAEDYIAKPFSVGELLLRVQALLRRCEPHQADRPDVLHLPNGLKLNFSSHRFFKGEKEINFSPREILLLKNLLDRRGEVVRREELLKNVWGADVFVELGNIEVHIRHLREKLEDDPAHPILISTIRGVGYRFDG